MVENLLGKTAVVTGAGQGIGRAVTLLLAKAGADVVIADYNPQTAEAVSREVESLNRRSLVCPVDIGDVPAVETMFSKVVNQFGHLDILVNNAGVDRNRVGQFDARQFARNVFLYAGWGDADGATGA